MNQRQILSNLLNDRLLEGQSRIFKKFEKEFEELESLGFKVFAFGIHENKTQLVATDSVVNVFTPQLASYLHAVLTAAQPPVIPIAQQLSLNSTFSSPNSAVLIPSPSTKSSMIPLSCPSSSLNSPSLISPPDPPPSHPNSFSLASSSILISHTSLSSSPSLFSSPSLTFHPFTSPSLSTSAIFTSPSLISSSSTISPTIPSRQSPSLITFPTSSFISASTLSFVSPSLTCTPAHVLVSKPSKCKSDSVIETPPSSDTITLTTSSNASALYSSPHSPYQDSRSTSESLSIKSQSNTSKSKSLPSSHLLKAISKLSSLKAS